MDIWYTTDGTTPEKDGPASIKYTAPIEIDEAKTIKAIAVSTDGAATSEILTVQYTVRAGWHPIPDRTLGTTSPITTFGDSTINGIAYGKDIFVAGGADGKMAWSDDGLKWNKVSNSTFGTTAIQTIAYGKAGTADIFVAGGDAVSGTGPKMAWSSDGKTWTAITTSGFFGTFTDPIYAIAYGKPGVTPTDTFVAVGGNGRIAWSHDGKNWTKITQDGSDLGFSIGQSIITVAYGDAGNGIFVAGCMTGKMLWSEDGKTWTNITDHPFGDSAISAIAYGNNKFIAAGVDGKMATSTDGKNWTAVADSAFGTSAITAIAYGKDMFIAVGANGKMATSTNGNTWTGIPAGINENQYYGNSGTFGNYSIYSIAYGNNKFVATGYRGNMSWFFYK
jgi:hypothetical protein